MSQWGIWISSSGICVNDDGINKHSGYRWKISSFSLFQVGLWLEWVEEEEEKVFGFKHFELLVLWEQSRRNFLCIVVVGKMDLNLREIGAGSKNGIS